MACAILQVPAEFKDVLDNTVVAALSHSSAHVCCAHNLCNTFCWTIVLFTNTYHIGLINHDIYMHTLLNCAFSTCTGRLNHLYPLFFVWLTVTLAHIPRQWFFTDVGFWGALTSICILTVLWKLSTIQNGVVSGKNLINCHTVIYLEYILFFQMVNRWWWEDYTNNSVLLAPVPFNENPWFCNL